MSLCVCVMLATPGERVCSFWGSCKMAEYVVVIVTVVVLTSTFFFFKGSDDYIIFFVFKLIMCFFCNRVFNPFVYTRVWPAVVD